MKQWRMKAPCVDCPFNKDGPGRTLGDSLRPGRMAEIKRVLKKGGHFTCHKTTRETGNGTRLVCAGAIEYQASLSIVADYMQIRERFDVMRARQHSTKKEQRHG